MCVCVCVHALEGGEGSIVWCVGGWGGVSMEGINVCSVCCVCMQTCAANPVQHRKQYGLVESEMTEEIRSLLLVSCLYLLLSRY